MVKLNEIFKGITFGIFAIILFYMFWNNIFLGMLEFIGNFNITGVTDPDSIGILKTFAWISFVLMFIMSVPLYIFYAILTGTKNENKTHPLEILKGIACWVVSSPIGLIIYVILASLINGLNTAVTNVDCALPGALMDCASTTLAGQFSWVIGLFAILGISFLPFYYILRGYGQLGVPNEA